MATTIDTKSLSDLITEFRRLTAKDSISPESLGTILQRIADLLATAGTQETSTVLMQWYDALSKAAAYVSNVAQGNSDRNHIYLAVTKNSTKTGAASSPVQVQIQQATTERAGAMRAQQVIDLNAAKKGVNTLEKTTAELTDTLAQLLERLGMGDGSTISTMFNTAQISCQIVDGNLHVLGAQQLIKAGYVPYLFRWTRKRNQFKDKYASADKKGRKYCPVSKGWHMFGSCYMVKMIGTQVHFSSNSHSFLHLPGEQYSPDYDCLFRTHVNKRGDECIGWGRSVVMLRDVKNQKKKHRMLRFRFGIGFAKQMLPGKRAITPANLVSSLAEFSLIYDPNMQDFRLSK